MWHAPSLHSDVYERLTPAGKRPGFRTLVATQLVSGVWHGLFPGYWLFFATSAVMFEAGKTLYRCAACAGWVAVKVLCCCNPYMMLMGCHSCLVHCLHPTALAGMSRHGPPAPPASRPTWPSRWWSMRCCSTTALRPSRWEHAGGKGGVGLLGWAGLAG